MKILLSGYNGAMGRIVRELFAQYPQHEIIVGVDRNNEPSANVPVLSAIDDVLEPVDAIIDFSHPSLLPELIAYGVKTKTPLVICTTGLDEDSLESLKKAATFIPVFHSGNMSYGVHIMQDILKTYSNLLYPSYDIEIIEKHHRRKVDAPSGTALMLADAIKSSVEDNLTLKPGRFGKESKRDPLEIGIHAVRGGTIVGEHAVLFAGEDEVVEIKHVALSRRLFATGALKASEFIVQMKPGLYNMSDVIHYFK